MRLYIDISIKYITENLAKVIGDMKVAGDKYRLILNEEAENTQWRYGGPPIFDVVNKLFEQGQTKVACQSSLIVLLNSPWDISFLFVNI